MVNIDQIVKKIKKQSGWVVLKGKEDPYDVLISTIISQRLRDETTERVSRELFKKYKNVNQIANAPLKDLTKVLKSSGFYRNKAKNIKKTSQILLKKYSGNVPNNIDELTSLPGVGRKTANCVLVYAFNQNVIPVDTHVHRVSNRIGLVKTKTPDQTEKELMRLIPKKYWKDINYLFVVHGKGICKPHKPLCKKCPIVEECGFKNKNL